MTEELLSIVKVFKIGGEKDSKVVVITSEACKKHRIKVGQKLLLKSDGHRLIYEPVGAPKQASETKQSQSKKQKIMTELEEASK